MAATFEHRLGKRPIAMQRIAGNDTVFERQHVQDVQRPFGFVAARCLARGQCHSGFDRKDIDHVQRRSASAALVGASQRFAVDSDDAGKLDPVGLGEGCHERPKGLLEGLRVQRPQYTAERVVARDAAPQRQELPQQFLLRASKQRHVGCALRPTQRRGQRDDDDVEQIVKGIGRPWIRQVSENLPEFLHWTPPAIRESSSESTLLATATSISHPHAIPLPRKGSVKPKTPRPVPSRPPDCC